MNEFLLFLNLAQNEHQLLEHYRFLRLIGEWM